MSSEATERIHSATPHRRQLARQQGYVARSHDLAFAAVFLAGVLLSAALWPWHPEFRVRDNAYAHTKRGTDHGSYMKIHFWITILFRTIT